MIKPAQEDAGPVGATKARLRWRPVREGTIIGKREAENAFDVGFARGSGAGRFAVHCARSSRNASGLVFSEAPAVFPNGHSIEPESATEGDCHHNVKGVSDEALWQIFEKIDITDLSICTNGEFRPIANAEEIITLQA
jgi:hypothetical protein